MNADIVTKYKELLIYTIKTLDMIEKDGFDVSKLREGLNNCKVENNFDSKRPQHKNLPKYTVIDYIRASNKLDIFYWERLEKYVIYKMVCIQTEILENVTHLSPANLEEIISETIPETIGTLEYVKNHLINVNCEDGKILRNYSELRRKTKSLK